jgi:O-antigen/teichoic acid export membrane protein
MSQRELLAKRIGLVGIANLFLELNGLVLLPILTKNLSISDYSYWVQITVTMNLLATVILLGLPSSMVRFMASEEDVSNIRETFYSISALTALMGMAASIVILGFSKNLASAFFNGDVAVVEWLSLIAFVECLNITILSYFRARQKMKKYAAISILRTMLNVSLISYLVLHWQGIYGAMTGLFISASLSLLCASSLVVSDIGLALPRFKNIREYLSFGMPTVPGSLSNWAVNSSDRYVITLLLGSAALGYYSPGYALGNIIIIFITPVSVMLPAALSKHYDQLDVDEVQRILWFSLKYFLALAIPSAFGLTILSKAILGTVATPEIAMNGYLVTPLVAFGALFLGAYTIAAQVIALEKKTALIGSIWTIAALLNIGVNLILLPRIGIIGAAASTLIAFAFAFCATALHARRYIEFNLDLRFICKSVLASTAMSIFLLWLEPKGAIWLVISVAAGALIYFLVLTIMRGLGKEEVDFLKGLIRGAP